MALDKKLFKKEAAAAAPSGGTGNQEEGLVLYVDANDVDSYDGDGDVWYDITDHEYTPNTDVSEHFNTVTYTGNGSSNSVDCGFQPDLIWVKNRGTTNSHIIVDSLRGANKYLITHSNAAQGTTSVYIDSITPTGFDFNGTNGTVNKVNNNYVAWCLKAGGAPTATNTGGQTPTSGSKIVDGTAVTDNYPTADIYPTKQSVNTKLGFSVTEYTGAGSGKSLPHGLDVPPELYIIKVTSTTGDWWVYTTDGGNFQYLKINGTDAGIDADQYYDRPTAELIEQGQVLNSTNIMYAFASKRGVSKVGSFTGTGTSGNKIYTGFEPAFILTKRTSSAGANWAIIDNKRSTDSDKNDYLAADTNSAEATSSSGITFNRDGFTFNGASFNTNGATHIYLAFAKNTNETDFVDDTNLKIHQDAASYSGSGSTWTADVGTDFTLSFTGSGYNEELGDFFDFNGTTDFAHRTATATSPLDFSAKGYTIEAWINKDDSTTNYVLAKYGTTDANRSFIFGVASDDKIQLFERSSNSNTLKSTSTVSTNKWVHIAVVRSSSNAKFYINGELDNTVSSTFTPNNGGTQRITIGKHESTTPAFFNGQIGQVRVYGEELSVDNIRQNFNFTKNDYPNGHNATNSGATFSPSTTPNYWTFDGFNDRMLLSTTSTFFGDTDNIKTISGFITLSSTTARGFIYSVSSSTHANNYFYVGWLGDQNKVYVASRNSSASNAFTYTAPLNGVANTWKHICVAGGDGNAPKIYVNGVELTVTSSTVGSATSESWINYPTYQGVIYTNIGKLREASPGSNHWHNGRMGQVKLYDKTLSGTEVLALFNAEKDTYGL